MLRALRIVALAAYAVSLAALCVCPCPMPTAADAHGCCSEPGLREAPSNCCSTLASAAKAGPAVPSAPETLALPVSTIVTRVFTASSVLAVAASPRLFVPASPPSVLRI